THAIGAVYSGDGSHGAGTGTLNRVVGKAAANLAIISQTPNPATTLEAVSVSISLTPVAPATVTPSEGIVRVTDGEVYCLIYLSSASCVIRPRSAGTKTLSTTYDGGAGNFDINQPTLGS